jgi:hypothetical protein
MTKNELKIHDKIAMLYRHCRMYSYGSTGSPELAIKEIARDFYSFAMLHLTATMFITRDSKNDKYEGIFHRTLDPLGYQDLLEEIDYIFNTHIGETTLKEYIRIKRNKLATHGELLFESQPNDIVDVTNNHYYIDQFFEAMHQLDNAVNRLSFKLESIIKR